MHAPGRGGTPMAIEVKVPDIGDFKDVPVIEVHVKPGDAVKADDPLITLESDKATMDVPADRDGTVEKVLVKIGDQVSEGTPIIMLKAGAADAPVTPPPSVIAQQEPAPAPKPTSAPPAQPAAAAAAADFGHGPRQPERAPARARARGRPRQAQGHRREGPDHQGRREGFLRGPAAGRRRSRRTQRRHGHPRDPGPGLLQVRPDRDQAAGRASSACAARTCTAPGSTSRTSPTATRPTSPRSRPTARSSTRAAKEKGYRVTLLAFLMKASVSALKAFPSSTARWRPRRTR